MSPVLARLLDVVPRWVLRLGAFLLPLSTFWDTFDRYVLPKLLAGRLVVLVLGAIWLLRLAHARRWNPSKLDIPLAAFLLSAAISTVFAVNRNVAVFGTYGRYDGLLTLLTYAALFWLVRQLVSGNSDARWLVRSLLAGAGVVSVIAIFQFFSGSPVAPGSAFSFGGLPRVYATFGNPNALAIFLGMLLPFAVQEVVDARSGNPRELAVIVAGIISLALVFTYARSAWIAAALGVVLVLIANRPAVGRRLAAAGAAAAVLLLLALGLVGLGGLPAQSAVARALSLADPLSGSGATRLHVWHDTLALIASRRLVGYGPDTFGLVYPSFQTGQWTPGFIIDKAHAELLQIAASQGLLGVAAYVWIVVAFVGAFWSGRTQPAAVAVFAGWLAYQLTNQVNFSVVPAATPYWMFAGAALTLWRQQETETHARVATRRTVLVLSMAAGFALFVLAIPAIVRPYLADARFLKAVTAERQAQWDAAGDAIARARALAPEQSVYAVEAGNVALRLTVPDEPGPDADWQMARDAYREASRLGTFNPAAFRHLALADEQLGLRSEALAAARRAVELNPFDPLNRALLDRLSSS